MTETVYIGLLGLGTVGSGTARTLQRHAAKITQLTGKKIVVKTALVRDPKLPVAEDLQDIRLVGTVEEVVSDPQIRIVAEVMGTIDIAREYIIKALTAGKHVVTANKDLIAVHGEELAQIAKQHHVTLLYEASVAGGIPVLRTITDSLAADELHTVMGIVNGTTNYMLTKMSNEQWTYDEALKKAQEAGFAEANPTSDVDGLDAARKMVILTRLAFGMNVTLEDIAIKGIRHVELQDILYAQTAGYTVKLLGTAKVVAGKLSLSVNPVFVPNTHLLAQVQLENNAVYVVGDTVGELMFYGPGAGSLPTGTSVANDIVTIVKSLELPVEHTHTYEQPTVLASKEEIVSRYYVRYSTNQPSPEWVENSIEQTDTQVVGITTEMSQAMIEQYALEYNAVYYPVLD